MLISYVFADEAKTADKVATPKDVVGTKYDEAVSALVALDVVNGYEDGTYKPEKNVNRAEMAKLIITELGLEGNAAGYKASFKDLDGYKWAEGFIGYAESLNIISGYGNGMFGPGDPVTYDQALTMIVRALGYTSDCKEMNGQWPAIYVQKARILDITDYVDAGGALAANRGDIAQFLYNAVDCTMGYADADGVWRPKMGPDIDGDGDDDEVRVIQTLGATTEVDHWITVADADNAVINIRKYVGQKGEVFLLRKGVDKDCIVSVGELDTMKVSGKWDGTDVVETVDGMEYDLSDVLTEDAYYAVNGEYKNSTTDIKDITTDAFVEVIGEVSGKTFRASTSADDKYGAILKWDVSEGDVVDAADLSDIKDDHKLLGKDFDEDYNGNIDKAAFELMGAASLDDIKAGDVVYVYADSDDTIRRVAVGTETVEGKVTKTNSAKTKIYIDGKKYKFASEELANNEIDNAEAEAKGEVEAGDEVKLTLDPYGYIYESELLSGDAKDFAVILEVEDKDTNAISSDAMVKLLLADGTDKTFKVDVDAITGLIDGSGQWLTDAAGHAALQTGSNGTGGLAGKIIKYGLDKDGVIDSIKNPAEMSADYAYTEAAATADVSANGYYDNKKLAKDVVVWTYDGSTNMDGNITTDLTTDEDDYGTSTYDSILDSDDTKARYVYDKEDGKIVAMLLENFSTSDDVYGVVTGIDTLEENEEWEVTMLVDGKEVVYKTETDIANLTDVDPVTGGNQGFKMCAVDALYMLKMDGENLDTLELFDTSDADLNTALGTTGYFHIDANGNYGSGWKLDNGTLTIGTTDYSLDNYVIYKQDGSGEDFIKGNTSDIKADLAGKYVKLFDTIDDGNAVYNVILITDDNENVAGGSATASAAPATFSLSTTTFAENNNNGSVSTTPTITLGNANWKGTVAKSMVTIENLPAGLDYTVARTNNTTLTITFSGNAVANGTADKVTNAKITVKKGAVASNCTEDWTSANCTFDFAD